MPKPKLNTQTQTPKRFGFEFGFGACLPIAYTMKVPMDPQSLYYSGTHGSSKAIIWRCPWVLNGFPIRVTIRSQGLSYEMQTHKWLKSMLWTHS